MVLVLGLYLAKQEGPLLARLGYNHCDVTSTNSMASLGTFPLLMSLITTILPVIEYMEIEEGSWACDLSADKTITGLNSGSAARCTHIPLRNSKASKAPGRTT